MTEKLIGTLAALQVDVAIVERRFSQSIEDVGRLGPRKIVAAGSLVFRLARELLLNRPDFLVFFCTNRPASFLVDCLLALVMRAFRVRVVNYIHTQGYSALAQRGWIWGKLVGHLLKTATVTITLGPILTADVTPWVSASRVVSIPNTPGRLGRIVENRRCTGGALFLSNLIPEKGVEAFVNLAIRLAESGARAPSLLVGATSDQAFTDDMKRRVEGNLLGRDVVVFAGQANESEKWDYLAAARLLVFPSLYPYEAQPLTIIESMAVGTPVVAYATGGIPDLIEDGISGLLIDPGDEEALEVATRAVLEDSALRERLSLGARENFELHYSDKSYREAWARVVLGLMRSSS